MDNLSTGSTDNIGDLWPYRGFRFIEHDVVEELPLTEPLDRVWNLACPASPVHYQADPVQTMRTNVLGALHVLELARRTGARVLQASTSEIYGDPEVHPQPEWYRGNVSCHGIRACYDEGKRAAETLFFDYYRDRQADIKVARIFNTYGPAMRADDGRVVSNFIVQALGDEDITIQGDGSQTRSFQYIDDLIEGLTRLMESRPGFTGPVNLGSEDEVTVRELAELVLLLVPESSSRIVHTPLPQDDPSRRRPDTTLARRELAGWRSQVPLAEGVLATIDYFRSDLCRGGAPGLRDRPGTLLVPEAG